MKLYIEKNTLIYGGINMIKLARAFIKILAMVIVIGAFLFLIASSENGNTVNANQQLKDVYFTRTYYVIKDLELTDHTGNFHYYVINQFLEDDPTVIKVEKQYILEENKNYEFTFHGEIVEKKDYRIKDLFENLNIVEIEETDKTGLDQVQESVN